MRPGRLLQRNILISQMGHTKKYSYKSKTPDEVIQQKPSKIFCTKFIKLQKVLRKLSPTNFSLGRAYKMFFGPGVPGFRRNVIFYSIAVGWIGKYNVVSVLPTCNILKWLAGQVENIFFALTERKNKSEVSSKRKV